LLIVARSRRSGWCIAGFIPDALSYIGIIAVLVRWQREHRTSMLPAERCLSDSLRRGAVIGRADVVDPNQ
jgi:hypothetical protein